MENNIKQLINNVLYWLKVEVIIFCLYWVKAEKLFKSISPVFFLAFYFFHVAIENV